MPTAWSHRLPALLRIAVLAGVYYVVARLGLSLASLPGNVAPVWPPTGVALAAVLIFGPSVAPGVFVGAFLVNHNGLPVPVTCAMATGNTLEAVVGAGLLKRFSGRRTPSRPRDVGALILYGAGIATLISAVIGVTALHVAGIVPTGQMLGHLKVWWVGDALGALIVAPLLLTWWKRDDESPSNGTRLELVALTLVMAGSVAFTFYGAHRIAFVIFPLVAWAALRFGGRGATTATFVVAVVAIDSTVSGTSRFATGHPVSDLWVLDAFLAVLALTGLLLASVVYERDRSQRELRTANALLEARVAERTEAVRNDRERLEQAQRIAHIGSFEWDVDADVVSFSNELVRLLGYQVGNAPASFAGAFAMLHPDDQPDAADLLRAALTEGRPFSTDVRILLPDATVRWLHVEGHCHATHGRVTRLNGIGQDITEAKNASERIRATEERTTRIVEAANEAFITINTAGVVTDWNRQAETTFGWRRSEALGRRLAELVIPQSQRDGHAAGVARFLSTGKTAVLNTRREIVALHRDGHEFPVEVATWTTVDCDGERQFHAFLHDISEREARKATLAAALEEAREASRLKTAFLANMSHEIRTPMNGVLGMVGLLLETPLDEMQRDYIETMATSAEALTMIIDDVLDVAKIEAGKVTINPRSFELHPLISETVMSFAPTAHEKGIELTHVIGDDVPESIYADRGRLRQIVGNLVSNAVKFTEAGSVSLSVTVEDWSLVFKVNDTGIGIPEEVRTRLFEPFVQADESTTRRFGGTGLGLAICRQLATLMNGEIGLESRAEGGSCFWLRLPLRISAVAHVEPEKRGPIAASGDHGRVLVVEDNPINRKVAVGMLEKLGYSVTVAVDGVEAVEVFASASFDVVLMDCQMPRMDGYDATRAMRAMEVDHHTPIVAMTASAMASDRDRCLAAGMDDYLAKPVSRDLLAQTLLQLVAHTAA